MMPALHKTRPQSLKTILSRAAAEAQHLHDRLAELDAALGEVHEHLPSTVLAVLQRADLLRQEAEGLAHFLTQLAEDALPGTSCNPGQALQLPLQNQISRLSGTTCSKATDHGSEIWSDDIARGSP